MHRLLTILVPFLVVVGVTACDSDGSPANSPTPEATATTQPELTPSPEATLTPESTPGEDTIRLTPPRDQSEFLDQYADKQIIQQPCTFDAAARKVDCGENGLYEPSPAPANGNTKCEVLLVDEEPIAVSCEIQEPLTVIYYEIRP